ncbi:AT-hook motif nuclear-localized protein 10-like [Bidens hawaiensis]|uniref:AT-hook motif nuclear-localized protein 10-like n=1 Tax=Bidens hawaiensis TaxID=980011 RepID=UPI00404A4F66
MDSRESLPPPSQHHHHQQPPPPGMMMPPNSYHLPNTDHHPAMVNNNNNNINNSNNSMLPRFPFNNNSDQFGDGSGGFSSGGYGIEQKKKRGRPRKYSQSPDGGSGIALGLAPAPVNAVGGGSLENSNEGSGGTTNLDSAGKKHRGRPPGSGKKQMDALGSAGVGFTPHVIVVKAGEDISATMMSFSQQGPRTVCILSANGAISNVTLRQPASSGGSVTYEGRFEIISLSGSFVHSEIDGTSKTSGLSISLAGSDGRVLGGGVAGALVAAAPVQVVVGSFIVDSKKPKSSLGPSPVAAPNMLSFGGGGGAVPGASPPSESETSDESGGSPLHRIPGSYNNATQHHQQQQQQPQPPQHMQNLPMYSNMGWPGSTINMLPN